MEYKEEIDRLAKEFESCQKILLALGDENRRHLILEMIQMEQCNGVRVGTITEKHIFPVLLFLTIYKY